MENLDNKDYRIFPVNAAKVLSNKEAYIYLALLFKSDFQTGESNVLLETLSKETGYDTDTVSSYLHKAKDKGFVDIARMWVNAGNVAKPKTKNFYKIQIPTYNFVMVSRSFLDWHIDGMSLKEETDIKGFILLIKSICLNNCNVTFYSLREMAEILNLSYSTLQKLMTKCRDLGIIETIKGGGYKIMLEHFDIGNTDYFPKGTQSLYKEIYNTISAYCKSKGFDPPPFKGEYISQIAVEYPYTQNDLEQTNDKAFIMQHSVSYQLKERLLPIVKPIKSLNYFVKVLTNKDYHPPVKGQHKFIM